MTRRPPRSTRTDTLFPYTTLFRSDSAIAGGNDGEIDTVVKYAGRRAPWAQDAMKKRVNAWRTDRRLRHEAMVEAAGVFELWKGKATVGGWLTTGNTDNIGLSAVVDEIGRAHV